MMQTAFKVGNINTRHVTPQWPEIGLWQEPDQALDRYKQMFRDVDDISLVLCEIVFSTKGFAKWVTDLTDKTFDFHRRLYKKAYRDQEKDWGVWYFIGDLPLNDKDLVTFVVREWSRLSPAT